MRVRAELQASKEKASVLAKRYGLSRTTVNKWRSCSTTANSWMGPREPRSTVLTPAEDAIIVSFRQRTLLPLDDVMGCLGEQIPKLTHSSLYRYLECHGISRMPVNETMTKQAIFDGGDTLLARLVLEVGDATFDGGVQATEGALPVGGLARTPPIDLQDPRV